MADPEAVLSRPPEPQRIGLYLGQVVRKMLRYGSDYVMSEVWGDHMVSALHLISSPPETADRDLGRIGYHIAYTSVDTIQRTRSWGILRANPKLEVPRYGGYYNRENTSRQYVVQQGATGAIRELDRVGGHTLANTLLQGQITTAYFMDPASDPRLREFKEDIFTVVTADPIKPISNLAPKILELKPDSPH